MDLIIHKLLADARILLAEIWQALWHRSEPAGPPGDGPSKEKTL